MTTVTMTIIVILMVIVICFVIFIVLVIVIFIVIVIVTSDHPTTPRTSLSPGLVIAGAAGAKPFIHTRDVENAQGDEICVDRLLSSMNKISCQRNWDSIFRPCARHLRPPWLEERLTWQVLRGADR